MIKHMNKDCQAEMATRDTYYAFMLDYAAYNLPPSMQVAANIHRLFSSKGHEAALVWESASLLLKARQISDRRPEPVDDAMIAALEIIHMNYSGIRWRRGLSGVKYAKMPETPGQLMRLEPGQNVFSHGHSSLEATVVLEGVLDDGLGAYQQGDLLLAEPGMKHRPSASGNKACVCFVARSPKPFWRLT